MVTEDKQLAKVAAILAKAERTDNEAEREAFMHAAETLAAKYSFEMDLLRSLNKEKSEEGQNRVISKTFDIGTKGDRGAGTYSDLLIAIAEAHDMSWYRWGNDQVALYGGSFDMAYIEAVYPTILVHMVQESNKFLKSGVWKVRDVTRSEARYSFCLAYSQRVKQRMVEARQDVVQEFANEGKNVSLVLADKRAETYKLYWENHSSGKYYHDSRVSRSYEGRKSGDSAGAKVRISLADEVSETKRLEDS